MTRRRLDLNVNGRTHEVWVTASESLLDVLHDELGMADVRYGCGEGLCGTCTVLVDDEPVNGCLLFAVQAEGREVTTLRGIAPATDGAMHPLQERFLHQGASQCGFCTPGMLLTALDLTKRSPTPPTRAEIRHALIGNLCRCTGYTKIVDAIETYIREDLDVPVTVAGTVHTAELRGEHS